MSQSPPLTFETRDNWIVVTFRDAKVLDEDLIRIIRRVLLKRIESHPKDTRMIVDCSTVTYMASGLLSAFIAADKQLKYSSGRFVISGLHHDIYEVFAITRLNKLFEFADTLEDALKM